MNTREFLAEINLNKGMIPIGYVMDGFAFLNVKYFGSKNFTTLEIKVPGLYNIPTYGILHFNGENWVEPDHVIWGEDK